MRKTEASYAYSIKPHLLISVLFPGSFGFFLSAEVYLLCLLCDEHRALLGLKVSLGEILSEDTCAEELKSAEKEYQADDSRVSVRRIIESEKALDDRYNNEDESYSAGKYTQH